MSNATVVPATTDPRGRAAEVPVDVPDGQVVLLNSFVVPPERDDDFLALWTLTSHYFRRQPGFVSLRLHRAVSPDAHFRYVNVATWESAVDFQRPYELEEFRALVSDPHWGHYASSPALYEVIVAKVAGDAE